MRNLKRALSLALAFVMVMSLMIVGTSAKSYTDSDKIENQAAVEILGEIGVMVGNDDGSFAPDRVVTRAEMAVILTRVLYGNNLNVEQFKGLNTFTDVPDWAEGYVNLCASLDIIAGRGNGIFDPDATVTTAEAALMLSRVLGYFKNNAEFGNDWALAAVKRATQAGIIGGDMVLAANVGLTRDDVAQMTFNTLTKAVPVQYNELLDVYYNENKGIVYALTFYYTDTLGYKNFDLVYKTDDVAEYGRPATTWGIGSYRASSSTTVGNDIYNLNEDGSLKPELVQMLSSDEIITVAQEPNYVYTANTKEKAIYGDVGRDVAAYDWSAYVDGAEQGEVAAPANKDRNYVVTVDGSNVALSQDGMTTEIYVDTENEKVTVVCINQYLAEVTRVSEDEDGETYAVLNVPTYAGMLDEDSFATTAFEEGDYAVVTIDCVDQDEDNAFIATAEVPETATGVVTLVNKEDNNANAGTYLKFEDGTKYNYSANTSNDLDDGDQYPDLKGEYMLYLDSNGFVIGFISTEDVTANYLYVENAHQALKMDAEAVFSDASEKVIRIDEYPDVNAPAGKDERDLIGEVFFFDYNEKSDLYDVEKRASIGAKVIDGTAGTGAHLGDTLNVTIENGKAYIATEWVDNVTGAIEGNDAAACIVGLKTVFVDIEDNTTYVGYKEVPNYRDVTFVPVDHNGDDVADIVFIVHGDKYDDEASYVFLKNTNQDTTHHTVDGTKVWLYTNAYGMDGKKFDFYVEETAAGTNVGTDYISTNGAGLYEVVKTNSTGEYAKELRFVGNINSVGIWNSIQAISAGKNEGSFWMTNDAEQRVMYTYNEETQFVVINLKNNAGVLSVDTIKAGSGSDLKDGIATGYVDANSDNVAQVVYILKTPVAETKTVTISGNATPTLVSGGSNVAGKVITAYKDADLVFTLAADAGKKIVKVTDKNGNELVANAAGRYTLPEVSSNTTVYVQTVDYDPATVTVELNQGARMTIDGAAVQAGSVELAKGEHTVTVQYPSSVDSKFQKVLLNNVAQPDYTGTYYINITGNATLTAGLKTAELELAAGVTATWSYAGETNVAVGADGAVPVGAQVALTGMTGTCDVNGDPIVTSFQMPDGKKEIKDTDFGYVKVTVAEDVTMTSQLSTAGVSAKAAIEGNEAIVKLNTATDVTVTLTASRTGGSGINTARDVTVTGTNTNAVSVTGGTDAFTFASSPAEIEVTVSVTANANANVVLTMGTQE